MSNITENDINDVYNDIHDGLNNLESIKGKKFRNVVEIMMNGKSTTRIENPMARPTPTCCNTAPNAPASLMPMTGCPCKLGWAASATKKANAMRALTGNALEEKTGADVNTANVRRNGQSMGDNHATRSASENVITG